MIGDWCSFMKKDFYRRHITNNVVESYFKHLKINILQRKSKLACSELTLKLYENLEASQCSYIEKPFNNSSNNFLIVFIIFLL